MGIKTVMLTGDNIKTALAVKKQVLVDEVIADVLPNDKASKILNLKSYGKTAMVGDGINDAPALTQADVGVAIGAGTDIAIDAADVVLMKSRLTDVAAAIRLSRATLKNIHENLFWAFIYNIIGIPLAAGVWIPVLSFGLVFGITSLIYAGRYWLHSRRDRKKECSGIGKITAIVENERVEEYIGKRERSFWKDTMAYLVFGMFGEGVWEMLRPDCWYPVISYQTNDGKVHMATVRYGGFKNDWKIGESIEIAWETGKEKLVYACDGQKLRKKALVYLVLGLILLGIFGTGAAELFGNRDNHRPFFTGSETAALKYPDHADRVEIEYDRKFYELNETEENILKQLLAEAEIGAGKYYYSVNFGGMSVVHFYQGEEEVERFTVGDFNYILTKDYMLYPVLPIQVEYNGTNLGESNYITGFMNTFAAKVRERYEAEKK